MPKLFHLHVDSSPVPGSVVAKPWRATMWMNAHATRSASRRDRGSAVWMSSPPPRTLASQGAGNRGGSPGAAW